ncbi:hypothetical protein GQ43DRAFT_418066 [Delitschia confertaspora ATCC 74209]|uniref:F-box domain-containing protein n=1 Tax=Delitschia confertaspora ATCC 74209 TaxID=1513339 RepID=A0A9P4MRG8_9PLEO|nr:hypothetical protein GQ43DRAFT_418066 [Delitschia confertaspora ATCC 74209]
MEDREASIASVTDFYDSDRKPETPTADPHHEAPIIKRKAEVLEPAQEKKRKLEHGTSSPPTAPLEGCAGLPPEIWQNIFLSCSLITLGRLLQVNRSFHSYLTAVHTVSNSKPDTGFVRLLKSESIWSSARNAHPTKPPGPFPGFSDLDMCRLYMGKSCQFCSKKALSTPGEKTWRRGPGENNVRVIWPFAVRSCGPCLLRRCEKESTLLLSAVSALRPALPFALITSDGHYIPVHILQNANLPPDIEITKYYYKEHVGEIARELEQAQSRGPGAAEEWFKGLDVRGKKRMRTVDTWEHWEVKYQSWLNHQQPKNAISSRASPTPICHPSTASPSRHIPSPLKTYVQSPYIASQPFNPRPPTIPPNSFTPQPHPTLPFQTKRGERNIHDANEAKAARKADIERRCQDLNPPILPNILRHMEAFKAAIQISQPMTDYAWSLLYPRLLAELPVAQQSELEHVSRVASLQTRAADRRQQDANLKDVLDREWEDAQKPIRERLGIFAEKFIDQDWDHGNSITYENSPKFAVDLLTYVRRKFYADLSPESLTTSGTRLVLENMKWVYDNKVKPLTEQFRKELFLCNGSGCETNSRFYGFEGVIQHYGAKHTNAFSIGNVVVAWKEAEWPEEPPFHPDPITAKHLYHAAASLSGHGSSYGTYYGGFSRAGTSTPHVQSHIPQASPGPHHQNYGSYYGPSAPPPNPVPVYDYSNPYGAPPMDVYPSYQPMVPPSYGPSPNHPGYMPSPAMAHVMVAPTQTDIQGFPGPHDRIPVIKQEADEAKYRTNLYENQVSAVIRMAQDIWKQTSGIKDLPNSVRVYVLVQRIISKFQLEFNHEPVLDHFIDAFANHQIPRGLKSASGLFCKSCQAENFHQASRNYLPRSEDGRTYTAPNLFSHFKNQHQDYATIGAPYGNGQPPTCQDWKEDMIELPSDRVISGLLHAPGMNDEKLHMIATVFPTLFPTPLPRIGTVDSSGIASPARSATKGPKEAAKPLEASAVSNGRSGPSSIASSSARSPPRFTHGEEEYDPRQPALPSQSSQAARISTGRHYHASPSPPSDRRPLDHSQSQYYYPPSGDSFEHNYNDSGQYTRHDPSDRTIHANGRDEEFPRRAPLYREREESYRPASASVVYVSDLTEEYKGHVYGPYMQEVRPRDDSYRRPEHHIPRDAVVREPSPSRARAEADRFLDEFDPVTSTNTARKAPGAPGGLRSGGMESDLGDGSRYIPPPVTAPPRTGDQSGAAGPIGAQTQAHPPTLSNGPRYEECRPNGNGRAVPRPDSTGTSRRNGPNRRRDRPHYDYVPSRYYRFMSVSRDEPPSSRSLSRTQHRRYSRYEEQRRRLDQAETPQPNLETDYDRVYSRDQSLDRGHPGDRYYNQALDVSHEYRPIDADPRPIRDRYGAGLSMEPAPIFVNEYGQRVQGYEVIRIHDPIPPGSEYAARHTARYAPEYGPNPIQYAPVAYDRAPPPHGPRSADSRYYERERPYVYYENTETRPRRPTYEPEGEMMEPVSEPRGESKGPVPAPE